MPKIRRRNGLRLADFTRCQGQIDCSTNKAGADNGDEKETYHEGARDDAEDSDTTQGPGWSSQVTL